MASKFTLPGAGGVMAVTLVDPGTGNLLSKDVTYTLASNVTLAAGAATAPVSGVRGGAYVWAYQFAGTSPSLVLEALGPDAASYQAVATVAASGAQGITAGGNGTWRLRNAGANVITGLYSSLS